jgi:hypothetical protein
MSSAVIQLTQLRSYGAGSCCATFKVEGLSKGRPQRGPRASIPHPMDFTITCFTHCCSAPKPKPRGRPPYVRSFAWTEIEADARLYRTHRGDLVSHRLSSGLAGPTL